MYVRVDVLSPIGTPTGCSTNGLFLKDHHTDVHIYLLSPNYSGPSILFCSISMVNESKIKYYPIMHIVIAKLELIHLA